jgi:triosephosphate isomerase (TIM)
MNRKVVSGNWKMNLTWDEAQTLFKDLTSELSRQKAACRVIVAPPACYLSGLAALKSSEISLSAQNCHQEAKGAYTGDISAAMLASMGVEYCLVGHSERRQNYGESNELLSLKVNALLQSDINPIYCCGEVLDQRKGGDHFKVVGAQIAEGLFHLSAEEFSKVILAYEPVWAIGTGETASSDQAQEMHAFIRRTVSEKYGEEIASSTSILYGGSCNAANAQELFSRQDVDGGLIGGASLKCVDFTKIIRSHG